MCIYMNKSLFYALRIENNSENDSFSYEATNKAVAKKAPTNSEASTGFKPMTSEIPARCSTN